MQHYLSQGLVVTCRGLVHSVCPFELALCLCIAQGHPGGLKDVWMHDTNI